MAGWVVGRTDGRTDGRLFFAGSTQGAKPGELILSGTPNIGFTFCTFTSGKETLNKRIRVKVAFADSSFCMLKQRLFLELPTGHIIRFHAFVHPFSAYSLSQYNNPSPHKSLNM